MRGRARAALCLGRPNGRGAAPAYPVYTPHIPCMPPAYPLYYGTPMGTWNSESLRGAELAPTLFR